MTLVCGFCGGKVEDKLVGVGWVDECQKCYAINPPLMEFDQVQRINGQPTLFQVKTVDQVDGLPLFRSSTCVGEG